jgi:hypothetical protein
MYQFIAIGILCIQISKKTHRQSPTKHNRCYIKMSHAYICLYRTSIISYTYTHARSHTRVQCRRVWLSTHTHTHTQKQRKHSGITGNTVCLLGTFIHVYPDPPNYIYVWHPRLIRLLLVSRRDFRLHPMSSNTLPIAPTLRCTGFEWLHPV